MKAQLPPDVTLPGLRRTLNDPEEFVRRAYGTMHEETKNHGDVVLRLGITGTGKAPNYRFERASDGKPLVAYDGNNHQPWIGDADFTTAENWSSAAITKAELAELLREIRGVRRRS